MMKRNILTWLALAGLCAGCATHTGEVATLHDTVTGQTTGLIVNNYLAADLPGPPDLWLNASRVPKGFTGESFYLEVRYQSTIDKGWLNIAPGQSLVLTVDGVPTSLPSVTGASGPRLLGQFTPGSNGNWARCLDWMARQSIPTQSAAA